MLAYTYVSNGTFELLEKPKPTLLDDRDAIVKVTLASICTSDLHSLVQPRESGQPTQGNNH